ncbi:MAG TPA: sensor histidine kinase [Gammaproteobacteria bacterium]
MKHVPAKTGSALANPLLWLHRRLLPNAPWAGWTPYLWLPYLGFLFVKWPGAPAWDIPTWLFSIAACVLFLVLYFRAYNCNRRELGRLLCGIATLGYLFVFYTGTGHTFIIYATALTGLYRNLRNSLKAMTLILGGFSIEAAALYLLPGIPYAHSIWFSLPTVIMGGIIGLANAWFADDEAKRRAIDESQDEIRRLAAAAERERIARDLHDLLGHTLTLITVKAELAARLAERDMESAAREIRELEAVSRGALRQVREAVGGYRSGGLAGELAIARIALGTAKVELASELATSHECPPAHDHLFALVLREAITNVVRHAAARHCNVKLSCNGTHASLCVADDGRGGRIRAGNGIKGMRERLAAMRGTLDIESDDSGTRIIATLPLANTDVSQNLSLVESTT